MQKWHFLRIGRALLWALGFSLLFIANTAESQTDDWDPPAVLSEEGRTAWFPDIAADPFGQIHTVWGSSVELSRREKFDAVIYRSLAFSGEWAEPIDIAASQIVNESSYAARPYLGIGPDGFLNMTYRDGYGVYFTRATSSQITSARSWMPATRIAAYGYFSVVEADPEGVLHLIYTSNVPTETCSICFHVFYRSSDNDGKTWSVPRDISRFNTGSAKPQLLVAPDGSLHAVWESGVGGDLGQLNAEAVIRYASKPAGQQSWTTPLRLSPGTVDAHNPVLGVGPAGELVLVWMNVVTGEVQYTVAEDSGSKWSPVMDMDGVVGRSLTSLDDFDMARDSLGNLHLVMVGQRSNSVFSEEQRQVLHLSWDGSAWSRPEIIAEYDGDLPEWPRVAVALGDELHAIWFVRDEDHIWESDLGEYVVVHSSRQLDAPHLDAEPGVERSSPTTPEAAVSVQTPANLATPPSLDTPDLLPGKIQLVQEYDFILLLLASLGPTLALIALVGVMISRSRR